MKVVVAGGATGIGCLAARDLARSRDVTAVVIADRRPREAQQAVEAIGGDKVSAIQVDVQDHERLVRVLQGAACCLNTAAYDTNLEIMGACLEAAAAYADLGGLFHTTRKQLLLHAQFEAAGIPAVLGVGRAPGITNVQARCAAGRLDAIDSVHLYDGAVPSLPGTTALALALPSLIDELTLPPLVYRDADFAAYEPMGGSESCYFPALGLLDAHLSIHSEVATLPGSFRDKGVREVFFKTTSWGLAPEALGLVRGLIALGFAGRTPVLAAETPVVPRDLLLALLRLHLPSPADLLELPQPGPQPWTAETIAEVRGARFGRPATVRVTTRAARGVAAASAAASIVAQWLAAGKIPPGVHPPEAVLEPQPFFEALAARGIPTEVTTAETL